MPIDLELKFSLPSDCANCPLRNQPGPCLGSGSKTLAQIMYIAQNPGEQEVNCSPMTPLVGPSGNVFNRQLTEAGLTRSIFYVTNVVKCLTPGNRMPTPQEVKCCRPVLEEELEACGADVVMLSGELAMTSLLGDYSTIHPKYVPRNRKGQSAGVMARAGCVEVRGGRKWIATIHPAHVMRVQEYRLAAVDHLKKAKSLVGVTLPTVQVNEHATDEEIKADVRLVTESTKHFSCDVETVGLELVEEDDYVGGDQAMDVCGISPEGWRAIVFDASQVPHLAPAFRDPTVLCSMHNGEFDKYHLRKHVDKILCKEIDTMLATHYLRSFAPKRLKPFCVAQYTNLPYFNRDLQSVSRRLYNGMDCIATRLVAEEEIKQLHEWKLYDLFYTYGQPLLPVLEEQRRIGLNVNVRKMLLFKRYFELRIAKAEELLARVCGPFFNWSSPKQVASLLYDTWALPVQYNLKGEGGQRKQVVTTDNEARKRLRHWITRYGDREGKHKIAWIVLELLDLLTGEKMKLDFLSRVSPDGRIHPYYKAHGEETFRLSSKPNVQNLPVYDVSDWGGARSDKKADSDPTGLGTAVSGSIRSIIIPDNPEEDWILTADFSQMQLWIYAQRFGVKWLLDIKERGDYLYGVVYEALYKEPFFGPTGRTKADKLKSVSQQRIRRAKAVPLGFMFGRSPASVAEEYGWTKQEGVDLQKWWFSLNPEIPRSHQWIKYNLFQTGYIRHCFGQIMHFPNFKVSDAIASYAQSPEAFVTIGSMLAIDREIKRRGLHKDRVRCMLSIHDSLSWNVPTKHGVELYEDIVRPVLKRPIPEMGGLQFDHEATMTKAFDWEALDYDQWKREYATGGNSTPSTQGEEVKP